MVGWQQRLAKSLQLKPRNLMSQIKINMSSPIFKTDWLASNPVFYNEKLQKISHNINDVIDWNNLEFHPEGFNNYLEFGYSVFGQTPIKHVRFLRHSSSAGLNENGVIKVVADPDPVGKYIGKFSNENNVYDLIVSKVQEWEGISNGPILIPTSGGFDSRLLNLAIKNRSRISSFTYGVSSDQYDSFEVVHAKKISDILETSWQHIPIGHYHRYFDEWDQLYGLSTHAHGMYHIEFYNNILRQHPNLYNASFLSGIIGDAWAGSVEIPSLQSPGDLSLIGYTHGLNADSHMSNFVRSSHEIREAFFLNSFTELKDPVFRIIESMRAKIILLSYLIRVPESFGFVPWSPFLCIDVAMGMLNLPPNRRQQRLWQRDLFRKNGLDIESMGLGSSKKNSLNHQAMLRVPLKPLDPSLLREVIRVEYIEWINRNISNRSFSLLSNSKIFLLNVRKVGGVLRRLGVTDSKLQAYCAYLTLKPIENAIRRRNASI